MTAVASTTLLSAPAFQLTMRRGQGRRQDELFNEHHRSCGAGTAAALTAQGRPPFSESAVRFVDDHRGMSKEAQ